MKKNIINTASFPLIMGFTALMILGLAVTPLLKVKLMPDRSLPSVSIFYSMRGANAVVVDSEVTSKLEGVFSNLSGLMKLRSRTGDGSGSITLQMEKEADMDAVRFEVSTLIRQVYPKFPSGVGYPHIRVSRPDEEDRVEQLMSLTLNGPGRRWEVGGVAENSIKPALSLIDGVHEVHISGYTPMEWELTYDINQLKNLGTSVNDIARQIREYYKSASLGVVKEKAFKRRESYSTPVIIAGYPTNKTDWDNIRIRIGERIFKLSKLVEIRKKESLPSSYYRINGLSTITIRVMTTQSANQLVVANKIKEQLVQLNTSLPEDYTLEVTDDSTVFLKDELTKIAVRIGLSLLLLLLFIWLVSRSSRYLFVMFIGLAANILIAFIFYHLLGIEIHIYSLAGITISLGIIIDNTIVMADHIRIGKGISVFRGILAATLTTGGALVVVFFLDEEQQLLLLDFVFVIVINLAVSLFVSLFFIPALLHRFPLPRPSEKRSTRVRRRLVRWYSRYASSIQFFTRFRKTAVLIAILGFGLPVFLLPTNWSGDAWYDKSYNAVLGSEIYNDYIRDVADKALGGSLRLFIKETQHKSSDNASRRTLLSVKGDMYEGTTLEKTNEIFKRIENFLAEYQEIEQFQTNINGVGNASIRIYFDPEQEFTSFPHSLKTKLESMVTDMGVGDFTITGVGRGFNNSLREGARNSRVTFYGYNLESLKGYADKFKAYLLDIQRVDANSIFVNGRANRNGKIHRELVVDLKEERLAKAGIHKGQILYELRKLSHDQASVLTLYKDGNREPIILRAQSTQLPDFWMLNNQALDVGNKKLARLNFYGHLKKERVTNLINKENLEYTMVVEFDFIGSYGQKNALVGKVIQKMAEELPIGFRVKQQMFFGGVWGDKSKTDNRLLIILLILTIIYAICAVVFESLLQPFVVLAMIPLSFIGVFITFYLFGVPFGHGGYASFLLLSGLTVNSALYIINDLNQVRKKVPAMASVQQYIHAFRQKIVPIMLTIFSTVLGLVPFLYGGKTDQFWYSLSIGTMGGLLFSILALVIFLPLFIRGIRKKKKTRIPIQKQYNYQSELH